MRSFIIILVSLVCFMVNFTYARVIPKIQSIDMKKDQSTAVRIVKRSTISRVNGFQITRYGIDDPKLVEMEAVFPDDQPLLSEGQQSQPSVYSGKNAVINQGINTKDQQTNSPADQQRIISIDGQEPAYPIEQQTYPAQQNSLTDGIFGILRGEGASVLI